MSVIKQIIENIKRETAKENPSIPLFSRIYLLLHKFLFSIFVINDRVIT